MKSWKYFVSFDKNLFKTLVLSLWSILWITNLFISTFLKTVIALIVRCTLRYKVLDIDIDHVIITSIDMHVQTTFYYHYYYHYYIVVVVVVVVIIKVSIQCNAWNNSLVDVRMFTFSSCFSFVTSSTTPTTSFSPLEFELSSISHPWLSH